MHSVEVFRLLYWIDWYCKTNVCWGHWHWCDFVRWLMVFWAASATSAKHLCSTCIKARNKCLMTLLLLSCCAALTRFRQSILPLSLGEYLCTHFAEQYLDSNMYVFAARVCVCVWMWLTIAYDPNSTSTTILSGSPSYLSHSHRISIYYI